MLDELAVQLPSNLAIDVDLNFNKYSCTPRFFQPTIGAVKLRTFVRPSMPNLHYPH